MPDFIPLHKLCCHRNFVLEILVPQTQISIEKYGPLLDKSVRVTDHLQTFLLKQENITLLQIKEGCAQVTQRAWNETRLLQWHVESVRYCSSETVICTS